MRSKVWLIVAAFFLLACGMQVTAFALPRGGMGAALTRDEAVGIHQGFRGVQFPHRVFVGPAFGFGWEWGGPWMWSPFYYPGPSVVEVQHVNFGTVEFKVKPLDTKVYVDQKFIGMVRGLDHHKAYMPAGNHEIKLVAPDGQKMDRTLYVAEGQTIKIDEKL